MRYFKKLLNFKNINKLSKQDLYDFAKKGLESDYSFSGCFDECIESDMECAINCAISDFDNYLSIPYPKELGQVPEKPTIYRLILLEKEEDFMTNNFGISWYSNPYQTNNPEFFDMLDYLLPRNRPNGMKLFRIKAETNITNIDSYNTLWQRSTQWWENEIVVYDDTSDSIDIIEIKEFNI